MTFAEYEEREESRRGRYCYPDPLEDPMQEEELSGPLPGAIDRDSACKSLGYMLDSWTRMVTPTAGGFMHGGPPDSNAIPLYLVDLEREQRRAEDQYKRDAAAWGYRSNDDDRPYFHDPAKLAFDPYEAIRTDKPDQHEGVSLAQVWADPLARTFWLAIKAGHITSQYFRGCCMSMADWARKNPPRVAEDLSVSTGVGFMDIPSRYFRIQIFPYVVHELMTEGKWPWFHPGKDCVSPHSLGWKVVTERK